MIRSEKRYEIGIGLAGDLRSSDYRQIATAAEDMGFDTITAFGDLMYQPPAMVLQDMASVTSSVRLGVAAYTPWTHHPVEIAGQIAVLDAVSSGRAFYGLVRGSWMSQLSLDQSKALAAIADTAAIVGRLLGGDVTGYQGRVYSLAAGTKLLYAVRRPRVPLLIGTWSPQLAAMAGRIADELQAGGSANPAMVGVLKGFALRGDPDRDVAICLNAVTVVDDDRSAALEAGRTAVAPYFETIAAFDPTEQFDPELIARMRALCRVGDHRAAGRLIPDAALRKFAFIGTPADIAHQAAAILRAGAYRVEFDTPFGMAPHQGLSLLGDQVLPRLRDMVGDTC